MATKAATGGRGNRSAPQTGAPNVASPWSTPPWHQQQQYSAWKPWGWTPPPWAMPPFPYPTSQWTRPAVPPKQPGILGSVLRYMQLLPHLRHR